MPIQALTLSVARRCTVEGSNPDDTRLIALLCFEAKANVPGRKSDIHQLRWVPFSYQSAFNWFDPRSYDIRIVGAYKLIAYSHQQQHLFTAILTPALSGLWMWGERLSRKARMRKRSTSKKGKVSQTNICGQLVVTSILRMHYESRAQRLTPLRPR